MTRTSHKLIGAGVGILLTVATVNPLAFVGAWVGSTFPDLDYKWGFHKGMFSHRGITHSLMLGVGFLIAGFVLYIVNPLVGSLGLGFGAGYFSHLIADAMSPTGIPAGFSYYPRFRLRTLYKTGTFREYLISTGLFLLLAGAGAGIGYLKGDLQGKFQHNLNEVAAFLDRVQQSIPER